MKKLIVSLVAFMATTMSFGQSYINNSYRTGVNCQTTTVREYTKSDGTYVNGNSNKVYVPKRSNTSGW